MADRTKILSAEQESKLRQPIDEYVGGIQEKIDALRKDGTDRVIDIQSSLDSLKRDRIYTAQEKEARRAQLQTELEQAKKVEAQHKDEVGKLIADAENYLKTNYDTYYQPVLASCAQEKVLAQEKYQAAVAQLNKAHQEAMAKLSDSKEIKDENYVHKNRLFDAKNQLAKDLQNVKDRRHAAFDHQFHLIDLLRMSKFTFSESMAQRWENYKYTFNARSFLLRNGLHRQTGCCLLDMKGRWQSPGTRRKRTPSGWRWPGVNIRTRMQRRLWRSLTGSIRERISTTAITI